jgi:hypothetical protein
MVERVGRARGAKALESLSCKEVPAKGLTATFMDIPMQHIDHDSGTHATFGDRRTQSSRGGARKAKAPAASEQPQRRLSDKVLLAFDHACEQHNVEAAERLVRVLEMTHRRGREMATLVDAYERLWKLQHTSICDC